MMNVPLGSPNPSSSSQDDVFSHHQPQIINQSSHMGPRDSSQFTGNNLQKWFSGAFNFAAAVIYSPRGMKKW